MQEPKLKQNTNKTKMNHKHALILISSHTRTCTTTGNKRASNEAPILTPPNPPHCPLRPLLLPGPRQHDSKLGTMGCKFLSTPPTSFYPQERLSHSRCHCHYFPCHHHHHHHHTLLVPLAQPWSTLHRRGRRSTSSNHPNNHHHSSCRQHHSSRCHGTQARLAFQA